MAKEKYVPLVPESYVNKNGLDSLQKWNTCDIPAIKEKQPNVPSSSLMQLPD